MLSKMKRTPTSVIHFVVFCVSFILVGHSILSGLLTGPLSSLIPGNNSPILRILDATFLLLFPVGICGMLIFIFIFGRFRSKSYSAKKNRKNPPAGLLYMGILFSAAPVMLAFVISDVLIVKARGQVIDFLNDLDDRAVVRINDAPIEDPEGIVVELRKIAALKPHHSHSEGRIAVVLENGVSKLELELGRDSEIPNEYWVYYPKYLTTESNEVGRIISHRFDGFQSISREYD
jgi:hypothetical protein